MKTGRSLSELAAELERQAGVKRDYVLPTRELRLDDAAALHMTSQDASTGMGLTNHAHGQLGQLVKIPADYYGRMREENKPLLAENVNSWLGRAPEAGKGSGRMVRTLDGQARGIMSPSYRRMDHFNLAGEAVLPAFAAAKLVVKSCQVTETKLYIKATSSVERVVPGSRRVGDVAACGVIVTNSEVGCGKLSVRRFVELLVCTNGMVSSKDAGSWGRVHLGRAEDSDDLRELLTEETITAEDRALWLKMRDVIGAAVDPTRFDGYVDLMGRTTQQRIDGDPVKVIEAAVRELAVPQTVTPAILRHLIEGGDLSRWGLINAVTRTAEDMESYDVASELEEAGGRLLEMPAGSWEVIAAAA